jgi:serine/threonine-protein kinase
VAAVAPAAAQATQAMSRTTVLPGTATIPAVASGPGAHRGGTDGRGGRAFGYALLAVAVLAVFVIAALIARSALDGSGGAQVAVPDVTGLTVGQATTELQNNNLTLGQQTPKASDSVPEGSIIDQNPEAGIQVDKGRAVSVTVSSGVDETAVPSLVGLSLDQAQQALRDAHLAVGDTTSVASDQPRNTVTKVSPKEGETVPTGTKVDLRYASGENKVPDVVGKDEGTARNMLEQAGFTVPSAKEQESADKPAGTVLSQSPSAGETSRLGSTITLVVATTPPTPTETPTPTSTPTPTPTDTVLPTG